jgi:hypothetical protein
VKQCAILIVNSNRQRTPHRRALEQRGFRVVETAEWPENLVIHQYEVVIIVLHNMETVCNLAARMRAKPRFGLRVLIGVTPTAPSAEDRRNAIGAGFDDVVGESRESRVLIADILRLLRARPEYRCLIPDRSAA